MIIHCSLTKWEVNKGRLYCISDDAMQSTKKKQEMKYVERKLMINPKSFWGYMVKGISEHGECLGDKRR